MIILCVNPLMLSIITWLHLWTNHYPYELYIAQLLQDTMQVKWYIHTILIVTKVWLSVVSLLPVLLVGPDRLLKVVHFFCQLLSLAHQAFLNGEGRGGMCIHAMLVIHICLSHDHVHITWQSHDSQVHITCQSHALHNSCAHHTMVTCMSHDMHLHACRTRPETSHASSSAVPCLSPVAPTSHWDPHWAQGDCY